MKPVTHTVGLLALLTPALGLAVGSQGVFGRSSTNLTTPALDPTKGNPATEVHEVPPQNEFDIIVVGGGFSGVMAAYDATQAGHKTLVLEARHRIGGRSQTQALHSAPDKLVELGATWINKITQPVSYALCEQFGLETAEQYTTGDVISQIANGTVHRTPQTLNQTGEPSPVDLFNGLMATAANNTDIYNFDEFPEDEDVTLAEWVAKQGLWDEPGVKEAAGSLTSALVGRMPHELGAHYILDYIKSGKGLVSLSTEGEFGAQSLKIKKGTSAITDALVGTMEEGSVKVNSPVNRVVQLGGEGVLVTTVHGQRYKARKVIIAIPTNTYSRIHFTPPLPASKRGLATKTMPGIYAKVILSYPAPWWREAGLVGKVFSEVGPISFGWETSDIETEQYSLAFFVAGDFAAAWHELTDLGREEAIVEHLVTLVGSELADEARNLTEYNAVEWTKEEYLWGGPTSSMGPGMLRKYGVSLRESFGNLHFGGGETAFEWKGYLEGALTSGKRVAKEVIEALESDR
ncbi:Putative flavin amine oxidase, FAD/NAD(P)-binding domain superfamily [Colletotrichum destructivum]|uniref:Amine oxidase n=1 Tax=Colletotrichum destructivum TaxID=34406 RepID=A0AAX4INE9_9PEZI|nr:Putative flavin amine oxidase, FAD/NAD(P)-binding domain superfamily [Colletotrichum destructivum]